MTATRLTTGSVWSELSSDLRRFFRRRVPDDHTADDLLQETFVRVHRGLASLKCDDRLTAWVYRIAHNVLTDYRRKPTLEFAVEGEFVDASVAEKPSQIVNRADRWLKEIVATLPDTYREAIRLSEIEGLPQHEVAGRLGLTKSGVKSRIQRGRVLLKGALRECCRFDLDQRGNIVDCEPLPNRTACLDCGDSEFPPS